MISQIPSLGDIVLTKTGDKPCKIIHYHEGDKSVNLIDVNGKFAGSNRVPLSELIFICSGHEGTTQDIPTREECWEIIEDTKRREKSRKCKPSSEKSPAKQKAAERWRILNTFVDVTMRDLTPAQQSVWLVLFRDTKDGVARASQRDIAGRAGCSRVAVQKAIQHLLKIGLIELIRRGGYRRGPSKYKVRGGIS